MAIENRNLEVGTRLVANYKKQAHVCTVAAAEEGEGVVFVLEDGKTFKSPSAAGSAVMGGKAVNGWRFWSVEGDERAKEAAVQADQDAPPKARSGRAKKLIYRIPNQRGVAEGKSRFFCTACMKGFEAEGDQAPAVCPQGHRADDAELTAPAGVGAVAEAAE